MSHAIEDLVDGALSLSTNERVTCNHSIFSSLHS